MTKWRNFEILCNMCSCLCTVLADSVLYFKKKHWNRLRENSKIRHFVISSHLLYWHTNHIRPVIWNGIYCSVHTTDKTSSKSSSVNLWWNIKKTALLTFCSAVSLYCFSLWTWLNLSFKQFPSSKFDSLSCTFSLSTYVHGCTVFHFELLSLI